MNTTSTSDTLFTGSHACALEWAAELSLTTGHDWSARPCGPGWSIEPVDNPFGFPVSRRRTSDPLWDVVHGNIARVAANIDMRAAGISA